MAKAPTLPTITGSFASSAQLNAAFRDIEDAFDNTLSLDGSTPNSMNADLDMNGFDILNISTLQVEDLSVAGQPLGLLAAVEEANEAAADANSSASLAAASAASINIPPIAGKALNTLRVNAAETGYEHRTPTQALSDLGITATASEINAIDGVTAAGTALIQGFDAAAQRASLGLGSASLANTGTSAGNVLLVGSGSILQTVNATPLAAYTSTTSVIPADNTIPQITEGAQFMTTTITTVNASSFLEVELDIPMVSAGASLTAIFGLFLGATADAFAAGGVTVSTSSLAQTRIVGRIASGAVGSKTITARFGPSSAGTIYLNGISSGRLLGGVSAATMRIREVL